MIKSQIAVRTALFTSLLLGGSLAGAQQPAEQDSSAPDSSQPANAPQADNSKVNQRDRNANEPTADQQQSNRSDQDTTQQIRKAIMEDKSLSTYAHNVKVITQNGMVTLKGPVRSDEEKRAIEAKAAEIAGGDKVTNEMDVKPKQ
jgi:hyperosmotically inducible protein